MLIALQRESVGYCHWKSNWQIERWLTGEGDLDLLVAAGDIGKFNEIVCGLGFKKVITPNGKDLPGVVHFYGYDSSAEKFVHIHAHYRLVFGHDLTKNYHLPIENAVIAAAEPRLGIMVPKAEIEFILFVIRMTLKASAAEIATRITLGKHRAHIDSLRAELSDLESRVERADLAHSLRTIFPMIDPELFDVCLAATSRDSVVYHQIRAKHRLRRSLAAYARTSPVTEFARSLKGRLAEIATRSGLRRRQRKQFESGGLMIAFVGGDGSGKSTCVNEVHRWLGKRFETTAIHMGKPPKSVVTTMVAAVQRALNRLIFTSGAKPNEAGFVQHLRWLCIARDRYRLYRKARRIAANGGLVLSDRFPMARISLMDGPKIGFGDRNSRERAITWPLICIERWYYRQILSPDLLFVLRVDPETAVLRKTDEAPEHVRPRSTEFWHIDWSETKAKVIDSSRELPHVLSDIRTAVWQSI